PRPPGRPKRPPGRRPLELRTPGSGTGPESRPPDAPALGRRFGMRAIAKLLAAGDRPTRWQRRQRKRVLPSLPAAREDNGAAAPSRAEVLVLEPAKARAVPRGTRPQRRRFGPRGRRLSAARAPYLRRTRIRGPPNRDRRGL